MDPTVRKLLPGSKVLLVFCGPEGPCLPKRSSSTVAAPVVNVRWANLLWCYYFKRTQVMRLGHERSDADVMLV